MAIAIFFALQLLDGNVFEMNSYRIDQVALQLFTLRDFCKTLPDFIQTAKKVRAIGYEAVQVSGVGVPYGEVKKVLDDVGLRICATHEASALILENPEEVSERLSILGTHHTAYPFPAGIDFTSETSVRSLAEKLEKAGQVLARNGQVLSYHNHANEFVRLGNQTALDLIYSSTSPKFLKAELDTYWVHYGGGDVVSWLDKMRGRALLLHLKDYAINREGKPVFAEIGQGNLDWSRILAAAKQAGTEWLIIEQDICPGDPFDSVRESFEYLAALLR